MFTSLERHLFCVCVCKSRQKGLPGSTLQNRSSLRIFLEEEERDKEYLCEKRNGTEKAYEHDRFREGKKKAVPSMPWQYIIFVRGE